MLAGAAACTTARRLTDDQKDGDASLWVHTPYVSAGDTLELEIGAFDQPEVGIGELIVTVNGVEATRVRGHGKHWGSTITTSDDAMLWEEADWVTVKLPVPDDVDAMHVRIEGAYYSPGALGTSFMNLDYDVVFDIDVPIVSPAMKYLRRALSGLSGLAVLVAVAWALRRKGRSLWAWLERQDGQAMLAWLIVLGVVWGAVGYWWFGTRVAVATGFTGGGMRVVSTVVWFVAPIFLAVIYLPRDDDATSLPRAQAR